MMRNDTDFLHVVEQQRLLRRRRLISNVARRRSTVAASTDLEWNRYHPQLSSTSSTGFGIAFQRQSINCNNASFQPVGAASNIVNGSLGVSIETSAALLSQYYDQRYRQMLLRKQMLLSMQLQELNQELLGFNRQQRELRGNKLYPENYQVSMADMNIASTSLESEEGMHYKGKAARTVKEAQRGHCSVSQTVEVTARVNTESRHELEDQEDKEDKYISKFWQSRPIDWGENRVQNMLESGGSQSKPRLDTTAPADNPMKTAGTYRDNSTQSNQGNQSKNNRSDPNNTKKRRNEEEDSYRLNKKPKSIVAEEYWMSMLNALKKYKQKHSHCRVPRTYEHNPKLGGWVAEQRKQYILKERGRQSAITERRIALLNELDFEWNAQQAAWDYQFQFMQEFYKQHGHCIVPRNDQKYSKLTSWIQEQRRHYSLLQRGQASRLTPKRLDALNAIGFCWDASTETWTKRFRELVRFKEKHGHCLVPSASFLDNRKTSTKLGIWVCQQRYQHKQFMEGETNHHLTEDRIRALNEIGFIWKVRNKKKKTNNDNDNKVQQNNNFKDASSDLSDDGKAKNGGNVS